jgi:F-type H+-transporting ATPase subunit delta
MKITANQYAKTLYDLTEGKSRGEIDGVVSRLAEILKKNGQLKLEKEIIKKYDAIHSKENGIIEAEVISREKLGGGLEKKVVEFIRNKYGAKEVKIKNKIDENIKGGIIIRIGDEVLDGSIAKQIKKLRNRLIS